MIHAEHYQKAAGLVLTQKAACRSADDNHRHLVLVLFHMNSGAVAGGSFDINLSAAHRVAGRIAGVAVDGNHAVIHGIAGCLLRVSLYDDFAAVKIGAKRVAGHTVNGDFLAGKSACDIPLSNAVFDLDFAILCISHQIIQLFKMHIACRDLHTGTPPKSSFLLEPENAISCG